MKLTAKHYRTGETVTLHFDGERIQAITPSSESAEHWVAPALFDIQINGFGGFNFNGPNASADAVREIVRLQWQRGIGMLCPTVTTNAQSLMLRSLSHITEACRDPQIAASIPGIHVEGPYISPEDGPRGAHPREHTRRPNWDEFLAWQDAAEGAIRIVTLAPEVEGAIPFIERLVDAGVIAAIGHTGATPEDIHRAVRAGARLSTHLGNGAHAMLPRHPNYIWEQLAQDELMASLIVDGHHLPPSVVKCMVRCKGLTRTILVSDAVSFAGMPPGIYPGEGRSIEVRKDGRVGLAGTPYLAGAGLDLASCVGNFTRFTGASLAEAIDAASAHPARLLALESLGELAVGKRADLILFAWEDGRIRVHRTFVAGQCVYQA